MLRVWFKSKQVEFLCVGKADGFSNGSVKPVLKWEWIETTLAHHFKMKKEQSIFIDDLVIHVSAYDSYKRIYNQHGYGKLRRTLRHRWYSKSDQNKVIKRIHKDEEILMKTEA
jgi:hypothetical protein